MRSRTSTLKPLGGARTQRRWQKSICSRFFSECSVCEKLSQSFAVHVVFCRFAGNKTSGRAVAVIFGMAESTLHSIIERVACFLKSISKQVIRFPSSEEAKVASSTKFEKVKCECFSIYASYFNDPSSYIEFSFSRCSQL